MLVLGIESSSQRGSVALVEDDELLLELSHAEPNAHAEQLIVLVDRLFTEAGRGKTALSRVAVGVGPGSFTGLRVGIALAQGIALGLGVPVFGIPSLRSLAHAAAPFRQGDALLCPVLDARRGEAFVAAYGDQLEEVLAVRTLASDSLPAELTQLLGDRSYTLCGNYASSVAPEKALSEASNVQFPSAVSCAQLALPMTPGDADAVVPLYVCPPDAILPKLPPNPLGGD